MGHIHQGGQLRKNQAKIIIFGPLREKTPHLARAQQRLSSLPRQQPETAAVSGHPGCCYRCRASGGPPQAPPTASQPPEYTQRRPGAAGDGHRPPARAARCRFWLICDLAGFGFVNLFDAVTAGVACAYAPACWRAVPAAPQPALSRASAAGAARPPPRAPAVVFGGFNPPALRAPRRLGVVPKRI